MSFQQGEFEQEPALRLDRISYTYPGSSSGVTNVSLSAAAGSIYGLLGENGAGKTTIMRLMLGLIRPQSGKVQYLGSPLEEDRRAKLASIGALIEAPSLYLHLTGREHLRVFAHYSGAPASAIERVLSTAGISYAADRIVREYSLGMKQRLALATALLHDPAILILDEPTNGLDPPGIAEMRALFQGLTALGKTIIISSHVLAEVEKTASHIGILRNGRLFFEGTPEELSRRVQAGSGMLIRTSWPERAAELLSGAGWTCTQAKGGLFVKALDDEGAAKALRALTGAGIDIYEAARERGSLERDFLSLTKGGGDDA